MTLPLTVNETSEWLASLPSQCRNRSGGDSTAFGIVLSPP